MTDVMAWAWEHCSHARKMSPKGTIKGAKKIYIQREIEAGGQVQWIMINAIDFCSAAFRNPLESGGERDNPKKNANGNSERNSPKNGGEGEDRHQVMRR